MRIGRRQDSHFPKGMVTQGCGSAAGTGYRSVLAALLCLLVLGACGLDRGGTMSLFAAAVDGEPGPDAPSGGFDFDMECGDGVRDGSEACDGTDLGGEDCVSLGYANGTLSCGANCQFDESACLASSSDDWFDPSWTHRKLISINHEKIDEALADFPVLLSFVDPDLAVHADEQGRDIVFMANGGSSFPHEIESFDSNTGKLVAWVLLPQISATETTAFYMYYGAEDVPTQEAVAETWANGFVAVWHLGEASASGGSDMTHVDSSVNGHDGAQKGNHQIAGKIGFAQRFDGEDDEINIAQPQTIALGQSDCTVSAWVKTVEGDSMGILIKGPPDNHAGQDKLIGLHHNSDGFGVDHGWVGYEGGSTVVADGSWHHVAWVQQYNAEGDDERWWLYVDGVLEESRLADTDEDHESHTVRLGGRMKNSYFDKFFEGEIDELRISAAVRTASWLSASYRNQLDPSSFYTVSADEPTAY